METLDVKKYGYPLANGYGITTDLALIRSEFESGWPRQRRTYLHNASAVTLSWKLRVNAARDLNAWLQGLDAGAFFICPLLSGNDSDAEIIAPVEIRRTSGVRAERVQNTDEFIVSFEAETKSFSGYQAKSTAAAGITPPDYPANLPLPLQQGFASDHGSRNLTAYTLIYEMNTETLGRWLDFAGYAGTGWFRSRMVSPNVPCGLEYIRFTGNPSQALVAPDKWQVSIEAESRLAMSILDAFLPPTGDCTYDADETYDDANETYDCGGVVPPQGNFVMPAGVVTISASASGTGPQTATAEIAFLPDGSVVTNPASSPAWAIWHTNPATLPDPGVALNVVAEVSIDGGASWAFYTPGADGPYLSLKNEVRIRNRVSDNISKAESLTVGLAFESGVIGPATYANGVLQLNAEITVSNPGQGIIPGFALDDSFIGSGNVGEPAGALSLGVTIYPDGRTFTYNGGGIGAPWYAPETPGAGNGKWIVVTKTGGAQSTGLEGVRIPMSAPLDYSIFKDSGTNQSNFASYNGTLQIYDAATGGNLLGSGTLTLTGEITP